jgi:hypothetical protein
MTTLEVKEASWSSSRPNGWETASLAFVVVQAKFRCLRSRTPVAARPALSRRFPIAPRGT